MRDVSFDEIGLDLKWKYLEVKETKTIVQKTQLSVEVSSSKTIDKEEVKASASSTREGKPTLDLDHHLACYIVKKEIVSPK